MTVVTITPLTHDGLIKTDINIQSCGRGNALWDEFIPRVPEGISPATAMLVTKFYSITYPTNSSLKNHPKPIIRIRKILRNEPDVYLGGRFRHQPLDAK